MPRRCRQTGLRPSRRKPTSRPHRPLQNRIFWVLRSVSLHSTVRFEVGRKGDLNLLALHTYETAGDREIRIAVTLAGAHVELPSVPWTGDDLAGERAFTDWSSRVWTGIVDRKKRTVHIEQCDPDSVDVDGLAGARRNLFDFRHRGKLRHAASWIVCGGAIRPPRNGPRT